MSHSTFVTRRKALLSVGSVAATTVLSGVPGLANAQSDRPVRLVLPNATGSGVDAITRAAQSAFGKALGTSVVVENQPGAGGVVGLQTVFWLPKKPISFTAWSSETTLSHSTCTNHSLRSGSDINSRW